MKESPNLSELRKIVTRIETKTPSEPVQFIRFDVFKGSVSEEGTVSKLRSVGSAYVREGHQTYTVVLKTFLKEKYYLLPNTKPNFPGDYVILTREPHFQAHRKFFWNSVGEGKLLEGANHGLMKLSWDLLAGDIYMSLHPTSKGAEVDASNVRVA